MDISLHLVREMLNKLPPRPWTASAFVQKFELRDKYGSEIYPSPGVLKFLEEAPEIIRLLVTSIELNLKAEDVEVKRLIREAKERGELPKPSWE